MREIGEIELSIQGGTEEIEALGEAGKVEESMEKLQAVEALKNLKTDKERELQNLNETAGASGHQKLRVCEICGAMLSVLDSDKRLADHFGGKVCTFPLLHRDCIKAAGPQSYSNIIICLQYTRKQAAY
jgi:hypothetical protein